MNPLPVCTNTRDYAVVIGIRHYPSFGDLNGPIEDARSFFSWLIDPQKGSVPAENCQFIESTLDPADDFPERPIQAQIDQAFRRVWQRLLASGQNGHRFYFYFNGHGIGVRQANTALLMANFETSFFRNSALSSEGYLNRIIGSGRFQEVVFLLDCCRNQLLGVNGQDPTFSWPSDNLNPTVGQTAIWVGYATEHLNKAFEAEVELNPGSQDGSLFRGHFTQALVKGLNGEAADFRTGRITPESLKTYLELETPKIAQLKNHNQRARITNNFPAGIPTTFGVTQFQTKANYHIDRSAARLGNVILVTGTNMTIRSRDRDPFPWEITLPNDTYMLIDEQTGDSLTLNVMPGLQTDTIQITF